MISLRFGLRGNRTHFAPGELISGAADWESPTAPQRAEVRLGWSTQGKGSTDERTVERVKFTDLAATDLRTFQLTAPAEPYSFSGKLISLIWVVELVLEPGGRVERCEIVIAPERREVLLAGVEEA